MVLGPALPAGGMERTEPALQRELAAMELRQKQRDEVEAETQAAFKLAKERGERFKKQLD